MSISLCLLLMLSPMSYSFNLHYCGGHLIAIESVFKTHKGCGMEDITTIFSSQETLLQTDCCEDVLLNPNGIEDFSVDIDSKITDSWVKVMIPTNQISKIPSSKSLAVVLLPRPPSLIYHRYMRFQQLLTYG